MKTQNAPSLSRTAQWPGRIKAFTFNDLLAVLLVLAILAALVLPALAATKGRELTTSCLNNLRQLQVAYHLYAEDFNDLIVLNQKGEGSSSNWVSGVMSGGGNGSAGIPTDPTNYVLLEEGLLYAYCKHTTIYKCPADTGLNPQSLMPTVRSYSINCYMNGFDVAQDAGLIPNPTPPGYYAVQTRLSQVSSPPPANRIVFVDESAGSIDDGQYATPPTGGNNIYGYGPIDFWLNHPTARHNNGAVFSFADGHTVSHAWLGTQLQQWDATNFIGNDRNPVNGPDLIDLQWVQAGMALPAGQN
jgi:prepilin-type processing-associated H-X9-DG protein